MSPLDRRQAVWFFLLAFAVLAVGFGLRDPWPADEPRFVLVARQMIESGDWLFPHRGSELYPDKPPFYFWLLALSYTAVGSWRWSFLLPSLVAAMGTLGLVYDLGRRLWSPRAGLWAAVAVLASVQFVYQAKRAQIDPTLVLLTTLGFYGICRHALLGPHWRWYLAGCFAAGVGVISKGVGFLPLLALLPLALMTRARWHGLAPATPGQAWRWIAGAAVLLLPVALWLVPVLLAAYSGDDPSRHEYVGNILFKQTAQRYAGAWHHRMPAWYFLQVIALFWLPFTLALPWLLQPWRQAWRDRDARVWLPLGWFLLVLAFFSASAGKRDMYILPALPALALAAAPFLEDITARRGFRRLVLGFVVALGGLLFAAGVAALTGEPGFERKLVAERGLGEDATWLWWMLVVAGGIGLVAAILGRMRGALMACGMLLTALWTGWGLVVHPLLDDENSARGLMRQARVLAGADVVIGLVDWKEQNLLQADGAVTEFGFRPPALEQLRRGERWLAEDPAHRRLLLQTGDALDCLDFDHAGAQRVGVANRRTWWLLAYPLRSTCAPADAQAEPRPLD